MALFYKVSYQALKLHSSSRGVITAAAQVVAPPLPETDSSSSSFVTAPFRTRESDPTRHTSEHVGRFYTVAPEDIRALHANGVPGKYRLQIKTFAETAVMVRRPALEIMGYLRRADYTKPVNKFVIYGELGTGKTLTLLHVLHYGYRSKHIVIHIGWAQTWFRFPKEVADSKTKKGHFDLPLDAATWLANFKIQNEHILNEINLKVSKNYEWDSEESTTKDSPLLGMIDFGISRVKYACDIVNALMDELKQASTAGRCKILVAIDGYNAFFSGPTWVKNDQRVRVEPGLVTLTDAFLNITRSDWRNGQIVVVVDNTATKLQRESHLPRYLLTKQGFDHLDPFLPIAVENFTEDEFYSMVEYYKNRKWIRDIDSESEKELKLLTNCNPYKLMEYCNQL